MSLLNEVWFVSITSFSNVPFWSICYEFWYYVGFALVMFLPLRQGLLLTGALALLLGPKIALLAPIWVAGVVLYRWQILNSISERQAWLLAVGSLLGIIGFHQADITGLVANQIKAVIGPDSALDKEYLVQVRGVITEVKVRRLRHGLTLDGRHLKVAKVRSEGESTLRFILTEGRNRQIRRMCELVGMHVMDLVRIRIGTLRLGDLAEGKWRVLGDHERAMLINP